ALVAIVRCLPRRSIPVKPPRETDMQRLMIGLAALGLAGLAAGLSANRAPENVATGGNAPTAVSSVPMKIRVEEKNPWTNLELNNKERDFQFVIVTDRTGGHRPGVFGEAVRKINLLQPEFVISVGDLIEGG